jgi:hypothetical protein
MNQTNAMMVAVSIALGSVKVIGLIATPALTIINTVCDVSSCHNEKNAGNRPPGQYMARGCV